MPDNAAGAVSLDTSVRGLSADAAGEKLACSMGLGPCYLYDLAYAKVC